MRARPIDEITLPFRRANYCHCSRCRKHLRVDAFIQGRVPRRGFQLISGAELLRTYMPKVARPRPSPSRAGRACSEGPGPTGRRRPFAWAHWTRSPASGRTTTRPALTRHRGLRFPRTASCATQGRHRTGDPGSRLRGRRSRAPPRSPALRPGPDVVPNEHELRVFSWSMSDCCSRRAAREMHATRSRSLNCCPDIHSAPVAWQPRIGAIGAGRNAWTCLSISSACRQAPSALVA